jgi:hypothetical protein
MEKKQSPMMVIYEIVFPPKLVSPNGEACQVV